MKDRLLFCYITVLFVGLLTACADRKAPIGDEAAAPPKNIVLIVVDTLRADHVGCYGDRATTPNLDQLASEGMKFTRAFSHIPVTGPSHVSMFTGLYPTDHGVEANAKIVPDDLEMLAERLRLQGFATVGVVSLGVLRSKFGFDQGFDVFDDTFGAQWFRRADEITDRALSLVDELSDDRAFLFVHYSDPHEPYSPPMLQYPRVRLRIGGEEIAEVTADGEGQFVELHLDPGETTIELEAIDDLSSPLSFREMRVKHKMVNVFHGEGWNQANGEKVEKWAKTRLPATLRVVNDTGGSGDYVLHFLLDELLELEEMHHRYRLEVEFADREIGRLLRGLSQRHFTDDAVIVMTSDHGESLGEHGHIGHIHQLYQSSIAVPLIVTSPGRIEPGSSDDRIVGHVDLLSSLAGLIGLDDLGAAGRGTNLFDPDLSSIQHIKPHYAATFRPLAKDDLRAIVSGNFKLITNSRSRHHEFYDLSTDAGETANLLLTPSGHSSEIARGLETELAEIEASPLRVTESPVVDAQLSEAEKDQLRALGYIQ